MHRSRAREARRAGAWRTQESADGVCGRRAAGGTVADADVHWHAVNAQVARACDCAARDMHHDVMMTEGDVMMTEGVMHAALLAMGLLLAFGVVQLLQEIGRANESAQSRLLYGYAPMRCGEVVVHSRAVVLHKGQESPAVLPRAVHALSAPSSLSTWPLDAVSMSAVPGGAPPHQAAAAHVVESSSSLVPAMHMPKPLPFQQLLVCSGLWTAFS